MEKLVKLLKLKSLSSKNQTARQLKTQKINFNESVLNIDTLSKIIASGGDLNPSEVKDPITEKSQLIHKYYQTEATDKLIKITSKNFLQQPNISELFEKFSLPPDTISLKILQFMQQMQIKLPLQTLSKLHKMANKFPEKKEKAVEIAMFLEDKGIEATEELIEDVFVILLGDSNSQKHKNLLEILNHRSSENLQWIIIPFKQGVSKGQKADLETADSIIQGNIRLLIDKNQKKLKKINFFCENSRKTQYFVLYFKVVGDSKKSCELYFCEEPPLSITESNKQKKMLSDLFKDLIQVEINYYQNLLDENLLTDDTFDFLVTE